MTGFVRRIEDELQSKLDDPELQFDTTALHSADVMGRTKSFQVLVAGGMQLDQAARLSGVLAE